MTKLFGYRSLLAVFLVFIITSPAIGQAQKAEAGMAQIMKELDAAGVSVAVVKDNQIVYTHSFGYADIESNKPLTDNHIFRIASISKSFSATCIMQLVEAGKLSLDDDIGKLIGFKVRNPKYPNTVITLKMLMSHTSSLNDSQGYFSLDGVNPDKNPNAAKCYNSYEPGKGFLYCNLNYNMVGTVIERTTGVRFDQYVKQHVLEPLGLYGGYCVDSLDKSRFATLYEYDDKTHKLTPDPGAYNPRTEEIKNYVMGYSTPIFSPTGGMKISATDLARYMMMHMNYGKANGVRLMKRKHSKLMQTKVSDNEGGYGLALRGAPDLIAGEHMMGHTGSAYGLYSAMFFEPKKKFGFVVITNGCNPAFMPGSDDICLMLRRSINCLYDNFIKQVN
ncbi:serine hydrolase [Mucilaginibacter sp. PPCGB 2223]|uniref:serine hydrolase domain-containing protein n=1 Tax=Mucilaginibacter sp. PPCGB 2223 TaxID=1886027 RepID=UPI000825247F|nr:serine hydrolase domain-containing protein [Mucilaginibacter sp. PPCGB 2223]OCX52079.1 serine hydrolase [Mucilaginibacter sp. PPCGB 2223]